MPSLKARFIVFLMQNRHLLQGRLEKETWDFNTSIPAFRQQVEAGARRMALPPGVEVEPVSVHGINAEWLQTPRSAPDRAILYTVGGGYVSGSCADHRPMVAKVAAGSGVRLLQFDHRLAPEHPFPAALEDTVAAYRWLLEQGFGPERIVIMGDSAGGGLCLAALLALRDQGLPLPAAAVALSPWTDLKLTGESYRTKVDVCLSPRNMAVLCSKYYAGEHDPAEPWISPLYGDLHGLPPLLINVGGYETMLDDSTRFAEKARAAGVDVTLRVGEGLVHCYPLLAPLFPEATEALDEICAFIKARLGV